MVKKSTKPNTGSRSSRGKRPRKSAPHIRKGKIVEAIVKLLHDSPGLKVETNVELPPRHGDPERRREIDVLVTGNVAGYEVRIAFSCKNENLPIKPNLIDEFVGTLDDVGIPTEQGIFVCVNGYTKGALDRAKARGIRTLLLKGLTKDRLDSEVAEALQFAVYLIEEVTRITVTNDVGTTEYPAQFLVFCDEQQQLCGTVLDLIFDRWRKGEPDSVIGEYQLDLHVPQGWHQFVAGKPVSVIKVTCEAHVVGLVIELSGQAHHHALMDAEQKVLERSRIGVRFDLPQAGETLPITAFNSEAELETFLRRDAAVRVVSRVRLPRILSGNVYYPLSERVARLMLSSLNDTPAPLTFAGVEGSDLKAAFERPWSGFLKGGPPVLANDDDGNIVDVRLLMQAENYGKVVTLRTEFERNPTPEFAHLLSWAYLMQASALSARAHAQTQAEAKRLLEQALQKIQSAIFIDQSSTEAFKRLGSVLRDLGRPTEAVVAYDRALAIDQNDFEAWSDRAAPLINQNKLQDAIDSASNGLQHASEPREQAYVLATRAAAHHFAQHPKEAITDLLAAWELDPAMIVQSIESHGLHEQIIVQEPSPQAVLLLAEMRWTKAAYAAANQRMEEAIISANLAGATLETLTPMPAQENLFTGSLSSQLIGDTLFRTAVRLQKFVGAEFAAPYIQRMQAWVIKVLGAESEPLARLVSGS